MGIQELANGERFCGSWEQDRQEGYGRLRTKSGALYEGMWHHGRRHGWGVATGSKGAMRAGVSASLALLSNISRYIWQHVGLQVHNQGAATGSRGAIRADVCELWAVGSILCSRASLAGAWPLEAMGHVGVCWGIAEWIV